ncbi:MAG: NCS2 family permease [Gammaproteobacteria bacterium]|nr:NCS2 family permease [Gammaproteobacteria bacterium]
MLNRFFKLNEQNTSVRTEVIAGSTTFMAMAYIIFVNPSILSLTGMDPGAVFVATCLASAFSSALMGLLANYPIALAPGMGLNAYFTYGVVLSAGHTWQTALGAVFISGVIFLLISLLPIRQYIIKSIPHSLKVAIVAGIGFFLGIIGFKNAGFIIGNQQTLVSLGNLHNPTVLLAAFGFFLIVGLDALRISGAVIISILIVSCLGISFGYGTFHGFFAMPPSIGPTLFQLDLRGAMSLGLVTIVFAFLFVDLFDNTGNLIGIAHRAGFMTADGKLPRINRVLIADSTAAIVGAALGTSTTTSYTESIVGVQAGGRTGITAIVVAIFFLLALFISPLAQSIPIYATAPALIFVACLMARALTEINWTDSTEYAPAIVTTITMPLTYSIADGIAFGFISYTAIKIISGRFRDLNIAIVLLTLAFIAKYVTLAH